MHKLPKTNPICTKICKPNRAIWFPLIQGYVGKHRIFLFSSFPLFLPFVPTKFLHLLFFPSLFLSKRKKEKKEFIAQYSCIVV